MKTASPTADAQNAADGSVFPEILPLSPQEAFDKLAQIHGRNAAELAEAGASWPMGWTIWFAVLASAVIWGASALTAWLV